MLYGELGVTSYDVIADSDDRDENDRTDADRDDADLDDVDPGDGDAIPRRSALRAFARIREFVLSRAFSSRNDDGEVDSGGATRDAVNPVMRARPNLNPMGASRKRGRGGGGGDDCKDGDGDLTPEFVLTTPNFTCLYPRKGNCHSFVIGPNGAAVLDVLFPPYDEDDGRDCTYYERRAIAEEDDGGDGERRRTLVALVPIDRPDDFDCLGGSYGCFGSDRYIDRI